MEQFEARINKLLIESDNESAAGDAFITRPDKNLEEKLGIIFGMIELFALPEEFGDKFFEIIADLKTEYYLPPLESEYGLEKRFEECLQRANRRLSKIIKKSIIKIELKNLNALIGLIYRNKIYLSQIGKNNAFLFHKKKRYDCVIVDIFSQAADKKSTTRPLSYKIDSEKMFSNIISGEIGLKDNLLFCNDTILEYLSQNELSEIISENDHITAPRQLASELEPQSGKNNFYAIIIQPAAPLGVEETMTRVAPITQILKDRMTPIPPQTSINQLIQTQESTEQYLMPSLMPNWKKLLLLAVIGLKKLLRYLLKYLGISIRYGLKKLFELFGRVLNIIKNKIRQKRPGHPYAVKEPKERQEYAAEIKAENLARSAIQESDVEAREDESPATGQQNNFGFIKPNKENGGSQQKISRLLNKQIARFFSLNKWQKSLLISAFALIFLFSQSIVWRGQNQGGATTTDAQKTIQQINEAINQAAAKNVFNDESGAKNSIAEADELLKKIPDNRKYKKTKADLQNKIDEVNGRLQKIAYLENPAVIADLSNTNNQANVGGLAKINNILFTFDNQNQNLYKIDLDKKQTLLFKLNGLENIKKIDALNDKTVILADNKNNFYRYDLSGTSTKKILAVAGEVNDFDVYGGKIYTLQADKNQIYKHLPTGGVFNSGSGWLKASTDLKNASAIAVDGGVFVAKDNGEISYYANGKPKEIKFVPLDPAIKSPTQLFSNLESNYLYILDPQNQRIVVYDKTGKLKIQYTSKQFNNIKAIVVVEKEKKIYALNDNRVYEIDIKY